MKPEYTKDIEAIVSVTKAESPLPCIGWFESATHKGFHIDPVSQTEEHMRELLTRACESAPRNSRIALVFLGDRSSFFPSTGWYEAANAYCDQSIAGIFVISFTFAKKEFHTQATDNQNSPTPLSFIESLPVSLWETNMPIFFDEDDMLSSHFCADSPHLTFSDRLSFKDIDELLEGNELRGIGNWTRGPFPLVDVTGNPAARLFEKSFALSEIGAMNSVCNRILNKVDVFVSERAPFGVQKASQPLFALAEFLDEVLPGSVDLPVLKCLGSEAELEAAKKEGAKIPYATKVDPTTEVGLLSIKEEAKNAEQACILIAAAFEKHQVLFNPGSNSNQALKDLLELFGVVEQLRAYKKGVPISDLLA